MELDSQLLFSFFLSFFIHPRHFFPAFLSFVGYRSDSLETRNVSIFQTYRPALWPIQPPSIITGFSFPGDKAAGA